LTSIIENSELDNEKISELSQSILIKLLDAMNTMESGHSFTKAKSIIDSFIFNPEKTARLFGVVKKAQNKIH